MSESLSQNFGIRQTGNLQIPGRGHTYSGVFSLVSASGLSFNLMTAAPTGAGLTLQQVDQIKGAFVDNSAGTASFVLGTNAGDAKSIPPGFQGTMPLYLPNDGILYLTGNGTVRLTLLNVDTPMAVWSASGSEGTVTIAGTVPVQGIVGGVPVITGAAAASIYVTPTVQAASYAAGTVIGGLLTFANATRTGSLAGLVQEAKATFASGIQPSLDLLLLNANPGSSTITDKTALSIAGADLGKVLGIIHLTDVSALGTPSLVQALQQAFEFVLASGTSLYGCIVQRTAAGVTLGSTTDMIVSVAIIQQ